MNKILRPVTKSDILEKYQVKIRNDYNVHINQDVLMSLIKNYRQIAFSKVKIWIIATFMWAFSLSMIINSIIAAANDYFWVPFQNVKSMFNFINVFWAVVWFAIPIFIIIYAIVIVSNIYDNNY